MRLWTDYPITELGDPLNEEAPIRECSLVDYDQNKWATVTFKDHPSLAKEIKLCYVYIWPGRAGKALSLSHEKALRELQRPH